MAREDEIRLIAYNIWEKERRPDGNDSEHWFKAEAIWEQQNAVAKNTKTEPEQAAKKETTIVAARKRSLGKVYRASPEMPLREVAGLMREHDVGAMPVCEDNKLVGIITDRDIVITCAAMGNSSLDCKAKDFMNKKPITVPLNTTLEQAAKIMAEEQVRRLPVMEGDRVVGILSLGDIALALQDNDRLVADTLRKISTPTVRVPVK